MSQAPRSSRCEISSNSNSAPVLERGTVKRTVAPVGPRQPTNQFVDDEQLDAGQLLLQPRAGERTGRLVEHVETIKKANDVYAVARGHARSGCEGQRQATGPPPVTSRHDSYRQGRLALPVSVAGRLFALAVAAEQLSPEIESGQPDGDDR